jgi:hypothetical protein
MRYVLALTLLAAALAAKPIQSTTTPKLKSTTASQSSASHTTGKSVVPAKSATNTNLKTATAKAHSATAAHAVASRRLVHGRWVAAPRSAARASKPLYQPHPDPERYQEIQKALQERGYFKGEPTGQWGDDSTDALKRFQADQNLPNDGKISARSLIGLGLGPKHDGSIVAPPPPARLPPATPPPANLITPSSPIPPQ